jgi:hypothetical protein
VTSVFAGGKTNNRLHLNMIERNQTILTILMILGLGLGMEKSIQQPTMSSPKLCLIYPLEKKYRPLRWLVRRLADLTRRRKTRGIRKFKIASSPTGPCQPQDSAGRFDENWGSPIEKACEKHFKCRNLLLVCVGCVSREDGNPTALLLRTGCLADLASATSFLPSEIEGKTSTHIWRCWMMIWTWPPQKKICSIPKSSEQDQFI